MQFNNEKALQDFLISFLENNQGTSCSKEHPLPTGEKIDILTDSYAIECKPKLNRRAIDMAAGQLERYKPHLPGLQPVIAGLAEESGRTAAASHRRNGTEVWFIDEIEEVCEYYNQLYNLEPEPEYETESVYESSRSYLSSSYDDSSHLGTIAAVAGILIFMFFAGAQYNSLVNELHRAAINWDSTTANRAIAKLKASENECNVLLANTFEREVQRVIPQGARGNEVYLRTFNRLNAIQNGLMQEHPQCSYPPLNHPEQIDESS